MFAGIRSERDQGRLFECLLAMSAATTIALMLSLLAGLNWQGYLMLMGTAAALTGGVLFSVLEMHRLGYPVDHREPAPATHRSAQMMIIGQRQVAPEQRVDSNEACFHHENRPESPGEDQGQLLSHLPGSTPFFEDRD
jgi:hypothetical protein